jgi:hypothetical protein
VLVWRVVKDGHGRNPETPSHSCGRCGRIQQACRCHEKRTLARLRALRSDLIEPTIALHRGISDKDAYALARNMRCEPSFIAEQPKGSFAGYVRNTTKNALTLKFPFTRLECVRMSKEQYAKTLGNIRAKYAVHYKDLIAPSRSVAIAAPTSAQSTALVERPQPSPSKPTTPGQGPSKKKRAKWPM